MGSGTTVSKSESCLCYLLTLWYWIDHLLFLFLPFKIRFFIHLSIYCFLLKYFYFIFFRFCYGCSITVVPISPHCSPLPCPQPPHSPSPPCCPCPWVIYTCSLTRPFPFFPLLSPFLLLSGPCQSVPCFHATGSVLLICHFVDQFSLIDEIIWYLSFTTWLISLSIMLSSSIHAVTKGWSSFFLSAV